METLDTVLESNQWDKMPVDKDDSFCGVCEQSWVLILTLLGDQQERLGDLETKIFRFETITLSSGQDVLAIRKLVNDPTLCTTAITAEGTPMLLLLNDDGTLARPSLLGPQYAKQIDQLITTYAQRLQSDGQEIVPPQLSTDNPYFDQEDIKYREEYLAGRFEYLVATGPRTYGHYETPKYIVNSLYFGGLAMFAQTEDTIKIVFEQVIAILDQNRSVNIKSDVLAGLVRFAAERGSATPAVLKSVLALDSLGDDRTRVLSEITIVAVKQKNVEVLTDVLLTESWGRSPGMVMAYATFELDTFGRDNWRRVVDNVLPAAANHPELLLNLAAATASILYLDWKESRELLEQIVEEFELGSKRSEILAAIVQNGSIDRSKHEYVLELVLRQPDWGSNVFVVLQQVYSLIQKLPRSKNLPLISSVNARPDVAAYLKGDFTVESIKTFGI